MNEELYVVVSSTPNSATPITPAIWRKYIWLLVATPVSSCETEACTITLMSGVTSPDPMPKMTM